MALWINDRGQVVGASGRCADTLIPPFAVGAHAVLWEKDGSVHDLGNLGGASNPDLLIGNIAFAVNNRGQVVGTSALPGSQINHAFLWTGETGLQDLGTLVGDDNSAGLDINDRGDIVGGSIHGSVATGSPRAFLWHKGKMYDLNDLVPKDSPLYLLTAFAINEDGEISGFGVEASTGEVHGFLASPVKAEERGTSTSSEVPGRH